MRMVVMPPWMRLIIATALCFGAGGVAALYVSPGTGDWYASIGQARFFAMPLPLLFFLMIVLFALLAMSSSLMWIHDPRPWDFRGWVPLFFAHLLVLMGWIILFFGYHDIFISMIVGVFLAVFAMMLLFGAYERSKLAFGLFAPYFVFTLYALGMCVAAWTV